MTRSIVTLSSIPPRLPHLGPVLQSLLEQDLPPDQIILYLPRSYRRFPDWDGSLPDFPAGITIRRIDEDYGPATKILPALREFAGQEVELIFCDDDSIYARHWHRSFVAARQRHPDACLCAQGYNLPDIATADRPPARMPRADALDPASLGEYLASLPPPLPAAVPTFRSSGFVDVFLGRAGVMVRPDFFKPDVFDLPPVIWAVDDPWLSGHLERNGVPIWGEASCPNPASIPCIRLMRPLVHSVIEGHNRRAADRACIAYYRETAGIWGPLQVMPKEKAKAGGASGAVNGQAKATPTNGAAVAKPAPATRPGGKAKGKAHGKRPASPGKPAGGGKAPLRQAAPGKPARLSQRLLRRVIRSLRGLDERLGR